MLSPKWKSRSLICGLDCTSLLFDRLTGPSPLHTTVNPFIFYRESFSNTNLPPQSKIFKEPCHLAPAYLLSAPQFPEGTMFFPISWLLHMLFLSAALPTASALGPVCLVTFYSVVRSQLKDHFFREHFPDPTPTRLGPVPQLYTLRAPWHTSSLPNNPSSGSGLFYSALLAGESSASPRPAPILLILQASTQITSPHSCLYQFLHISFSLFLLFLFFPASFSFQDIFRFLFRLFCTNAKV